MGCPRMAGSPFYQTIYAGHGSRGCTHQFILTADLSNSKCAELLGSGPVAEAAIYHLDNGGGRARARMALDAASGMASGRCCGACAGAVELLHNASLVHDDLQESDATRRGRPAVWRRFDAGLAICAGDLMISAAFACLAEHPDPAKAITAAHQAVATTARGQACDLRARPATIADYRVLAAEKTGPLLALPVRLALFGGGTSGDDDAVQAGHALAIAYQVLDDLNDLDADRAMGRANLCTLLEDSGCTPANSIAKARGEALSALDRARSFASLLPPGAARAFCNLADRLDSDLTEISHAA